MPTNNPHNTIEPATLSIKIYAAMLGDAPHFDRKTPDAQSRFASPFHRASLREHLERYAEHAARALDEARERLAAARPKTILSHAPPRHAFTKPITLVGASIHRDARAVTHSRAA